MCCVFTCCGWMIDLLQRVWTFAMSCCISSAICCVLMTSSLSGIAMGYNYSLAEYIDLKETNVSVYLKRGVFDDEIADDMEWRRAGHMPVGDNQFPQDDTIVTGGPDVEPAQRSGRRLDDSVFDSNDHNKFEGSLMKLTAKPIDAPITMVTYTPDHKMGEIQEKFQNNALDQMKAVQEVLNMRRYNLGTTTVSGRRQMSAGGRPEIPERPLYGMYEPAPRKTDISSDLISGKKFDPHDPILYKFLNPARTAVPPYNIGSERYWNVPKQFTSTMWTIGIHNEIRPATFPTVPGPVPLDLGPMRPSTRRNVAGPTFTAQPVRAFAGDRPEEAKSGDEFDQKLNRQQMDMARAKMQDYPQRRQGAGAGDEDYELDAKGLPVRKRREKVTRSTYLPTTLNNVRRFARYRREISGSTSLPTTLNDIPGTTTKITEISSTDSLPTTLNDVRGTDKKEREISSFDSRPTTLNDMTHSATKQREISDFESILTSLNGLRNSARRRRHISKFTSFPTTYDKTESHDIVHTEFLSEIRRTLLFDKLSLTTV